MSDNQSEHEQEQSEPTYDQREVLRPVEQAEIMFYDYPVIAVRLPDGRIGAVLRNMCDALKLTRQPQIRRIREDGVPTFLPPKIPAKRSHCSHAKTAEEVEGAEAVYMSGVGTGNEAFSV